MSPAVIFSFANTTAMIMWILLIVLPKWKITKLLVDFKLVPILFAILYSIYIFLAIQEGGGMDFGSLEGVKSLFTKDNAVLAGWLHYLAFDLLIGFWIMNENKQIGIHHLLIVPCLLFTFMLGPIGFLLFTILKRIKK